MTQEERLDLMRALRAVSGMRDRRLRSKVYGGPVSEVLQELEEDLTVLLDMELPSVRERSRAA